MRDVAINRIMSTNVLTVRPDDPAATAQEMLGSGNIHHLPVVEDDKLVGIVSSSDMLRICLRELSDSSVPGITVRDIMRTNPVVLESGASLRDAAMRLSEGGYHSLPVVDPDNTLVGIVTSVDLAEHLFRQLPSGDGSLQAASGSYAVPRPDDGDFVAVLRALKAAAKKDGGQSKIAQVLQYLNNRNRMLEETCKAAELYIKSGQAEHEHTVLLKRLNDLRKNDQTTL